MTTLVLPRSTEEARIGHSLLRDLVSVWPLQFPTGGVVDLRDLKGGNVLTDNGSVTTVAGPSRKLPRATQFTRASSQYLSRADNDSLSMRAGGRMTICAWVYQDSQPAGDMQIVSKFDGVSNSQEYNLEWLNTTNRFRFGVNPDGIGGNAVFVSAGTFGAPSTATWYFIFGRYDGVNTYISVNAGVEDSVAFTSDVFSGSAPLQIGARESIAAGFWDGRITGVCLWKRALGRKERSYLYNGGQGRGFRQNRGFF